MRFPSVLIARQVEYEPCASLWGADAIAADLFSTLNVPVPEFSLLRDIFQRQRLPDDEAALYSAKHTAVQLLCALRMIPTAPAPSR